MGQALLRDTMTDTFIWTLTINNTSRGGAQDMFIKDADSTMTGTVRSVMLDTMVVRCAWDLHQNLRKISVLSSSGTEPTGDAFRHGCLCCSSFYHDCLMVKLYPVPLSPFWTVTKGVYFVVLPHSQIFVNMFCVVVRKLVMAKFPKSERCMIQKGRVNDDRAIWAKYKLPLTFNAGCNTTYRVEGISALVYCTCSRERSR